MEVEKRYRLFHYLKRATAKLDASIEGPSSGSYSSVNTNQKSLLSIVSSSEINLYLWQAALLSQLD